VWDLRGFVDAGGTSINSWTVVDNYRSRMMRPKQQIIFWSTGDGSRVERGIWGFGHVTGPLRPYKAPRRLQGQQDFWTDSTARSSAKFAVDLDIPLSKVPIPAADLVAAGIHDLEVQRQPLGSNPSWVSNQQLGQLQPLTPTLTAATGEEEITVTSHGAGFGTAAQRQAAEDAAMQTVRKHYEAAGWNVQDVSALKCGWDLTCSRGNQVEKVEVKGVSGAKPSVLLTANELRAAAAHKEWTLAVVTFATTAPLLSSYSSAQTRKAAAPYVFRADLSTP
jgi:hypothetical protein